MSFLMGLGVGFFCGVGLLLGAIVWDLRHEMRDK